MPMKGSAGQRNKLVTIEQMAESQGSSGRPVETWSMLGNAWMERDDVAIRVDSAEYFSAAALSTRSDVTWRMLYQANMDPEVLNVPKTRRLTYQGKVYDIVRAIPVGQHDKIEMTTIAKG